MLAPALLSHATSARSADLARISEEQQFFLQAADYFVFWRNVLENGYRMFGSTLDREWVATSLFYCDCGDEAIGQSSARETLIFIRQLNACINLGQTRGVFVSCLCPLEPSRLLSFTS